MKMEYAIVRNNTIVAGPGPQVRAARNGERRLPVYAEPPLIDFAERLVQDRCEILSTRVIRHFNRVDLPLTLAVEAATKRLTDHRYQVETGGIKLPNGMVIASDRLSQDRITGVYSASLLNPDLLIDFKAENGWVQVAAGDIATIARLMVAHVQSCYSRERVLTAQLEAAANLVELRSIVTSDLPKGWPTY